MRRTSSIRRQPPGRVRSGGLARMAALALYLLITGGCGAIPGGEERPGAATTPVSPVEARPLVEEARRLLSARLGAPADQIRVRQVESRTWPDAGLGCPEPGRSYAQVLTSGYAILLSHADRTYSYHASGSAVIPCPILRLTIPEWNDHAPARLLAQDGSFGKKTLERPAYPRVLQATASAQEGGSN